MGKSSNPNLYENKALVKKFVICKANAALNLHAFFLKIKQSKMNTIEANNTCLLP